RSKRDWSSDVCSSDLWCSMKLATVNTAFGTTAVRIEGKPTSLSHSTMLTGIELDFDDVGALLRSGDWAKAAELSGEPMVFATEEIGRASSRGGRARTG